MAAVVPGRLQQEGIQTTLLALWLATEQKREVREEPAEKAKTDGEGSDAKETEQTDEERKSPWCVSEHV